MNLRRAGTLVAIVVALSFLVRITGITYGLPLDLVPDELSMIAGALQMLSVKSLVPALHPDEFTVLYYPPLISYFYIIALAPVLGAQFLLGGFKTLVEFKGYLVDHPETIWLTARFIHVCFGTAIVYLVYKIGAILGGKRLGIFSAALIGLSFNHVLLSHWGKHWIIAIFFMVLGLYLALSDPTFEQHRFATGSVCGLAFGASIIGIFAWLYVLPVYAYFNRKEGLRMFCRRSLWLNLAVGGLVTCLFIALHWQYFYWLASKGLDSQGVYISWDQSKSLGSYLAMFGEVLALLLKQETSLVIAATMGVGFLVARRNFAPIAGAGLLFAGYLSYIYILVHWESRYVSLLLPPLALIGGYGLKSVVELGSSWGRRLTAWSLIGLLAVSGIGGIVRLDYLLLQPDTRIQAREWLERHAKESVVLLNSGTSGVRVARSKAALLAQNEYGALSSSARTRLAAFERAVGSDSEELFAVNITEWDASNRTIQSVDDFLDRYGRPSLPVYYVVNYWTPNTLTDVDRALMSRGKLVQTFQSGAGYVHLVHDFSLPLTIMFSMERLGTTVEIYELNAA